MDPSRKRKIRLVVALSAAVLLATALIVVSFSAGTSQLLPSEALAQKPDDEFELGRHGRRRLARASGTTRSSSRSRTRTAPRRSRWSTAAPSPIRSARAARCS